MMLTTLKAIAIAAALASSYAAPQIGEPGAFYGATVVQGTDGKQVCTKMVCWDYQDGTRICGHRVYLAVKCPETTSW